MLTKKLSLADKLGIAGKNRKPGLKEKLFGTKVVLTVPETAEGIRAKPLKVEKLKTKRKK